MKDSDNKIPYGHWTIKENCQKEALKYETRNEFKKGFGGSYYSSIKNGWLDDVCSHMKEIRKSSGHWDIKENCKEEALMYNTRSEFQKNSRSAYNSSLRNGWLDELCKDMEVVGNIKMRGIYVFEFEDNYAYVGLTYNFNRRYSEHINDINCVVYKHIEETKSIPKFIQLTDYMDEELASKEETVWENKYISNGWNMLNIIKTGGLGGGYLKWGYDSCRKQAKKYNTRLKFQKGSIGAYNSSRRNGWLDDICGHMIEGKKPSGHWDIKENCKEEALMYNTKTEFCKGSKGAYLSSWRNGWLDEFFPKQKKRVIN